ncbi:MAG: DNA polymerase III subunit gamma/tau, partial [Cyclobacteriaceae bacterium]|nr:DNA polymerase III subunit gamma/tau [Cyclobacteriaceae bacterium]
MESFVVSARKYRPLGFAEVVGQEHITTTLKNAIDNNKLAQALLFCGPRGVGKTTCARIVARMINGFEEKAEVNSLNIFELDAASNNSVEDIRNLIDQVRYPPQFGKFKVYIIDEVHMLSNSAFNAFLKTLEEPPSYAIFILATTEKHKVIPTILSRCQIFDFNRIQISDIAKQLKKVADQEKIKVEEEALHLIAQKADGALRDGLSIFDLMVTFSSGKEVTFKDVINNLHILDYDYYFRVVDGLLAENASQPLLELDEILRKGFDGHNFIVGLSEHIRNLMVSQDARTINLMEVPDSIKKRYLQQAQACPQSLLLSWLNIANQCDIQYKGSKNQRLTVELALMKMAHVNAIFTNVTAPTTEAVKKKIELSPEVPTESIPKEQPAEKQDTSSMPKLKAEPEPVKAKSTSYPEPKDAKPKATLNLGNLFKPVTSKEVNTEEKQKVTSPDRPFTDEE